MPVELVRITSINAVGFSLVQGDRVEQVRWADIDTISVFKRHLYVSDMVCMTIRYGTAQTLVELNEQMDGYDKFVNVLASRLPGTTPWNTWFPAVAFPAFAVNPVCLYRRNGLPDWLPLLSWDKDSAQQAMRRRANPPGPVRKFFLKLIGQ